MRKIVIFGEIMLRLAPPGFQRFTQARSFDATYDRVNSGFATIQPGTIDWKKALEGTDRFHRTGIAPAVSESAANTCREAIQVAHEMGVTISCDLNYRAKLWRWRKAPMEIFTLPRRITSLQS